MREELTRILDGVEYTALIEVERSNLSVNVASLDAWRAHEHAVALQVIRRQAAGPEACRFMRCQIEHTSAVLHKALAVDINTFNQWFTGTSAMPKPVWIVLARIILEREEGRNDTLDLLLG